MGSVSPFRYDSPLLLAPGSTPYRHPIIFGRAVAIYYALQLPTLWTSHAYRWVKIALHLGLSDCDLSWTENGSPRSATLRGEHACFFGANVPHCIHWKTEAPMVWIFMDRDYLKQIAFDNLSGVTCVELVRLIRIDLGLFRLASLFAEACVDGTKRVPLYVEAKGTLFATRLLRAQFGRVAPVMNGKNGLNAIAFQKVQDYIQSKLSIPESRFRHVPAPASREELCNEVLARIAGMSEHHFIRQFGERTKKTPQEYVMQCRLDKAEMLIVAHGYSPKEAAYATGFCEPGHFYRRFRQRYGKSPHDLLKQLRP